MQKIQTITFSKTIKRETVTQVSKSYLYMPNVKTNRKMEIKWHEDKRREAV